MRHIHAEPRRYLHDDRRPHESAMMRPQSYLDFDPISGNAEVSTDRAIVRLPGRRIRKPRPQPFWDFDAL